MKKILAAILASLMLLSLGACGGSSGDEKVDLKVGAIMIGDETEGYTLAHMDGINKAIAKLKTEGKNVTVEYKKKVPEDTTVETNANQLIASGCTLIITNSYGHQFNLGSAVGSNKDVKFVEMTGDLAAGTEETNDYNAFNRVYESRYVSGVVAGMKLKALVDAGELTAEKCPKSFEGENIKIGYVGAFNYQEVVSGYTAFYLGIKSVVPNVVMTVKYTNSWFSEEREAAVGEYLMNDGCVIIGQHADSTGAPAAVQKANTNGSNKMCFSVGYNVTMLDVAPDVALTSATNNWDVYYYELFAACIAGDNSFPTDWSKGYEAGAVAITDLGKACADGTAAAVEKTIADIKSGAIKVFDTSKFTVGGEHLTTYTGAYNMNNQETIKTENGVSFFDESTLRSAPYFDLRIDGITELASDYQD